MKNKIKVVIILALLLNAAVVLRCPYLYASISAQAAEKAELQQENLDKVRQYPAKKGWTKQDLINFKQQDPQRFNTLLNQWKNKVTKQLEYIKYTDPKRYNKIMQQLTRKRLQYLVWLRKADPEKFKDLIAKRREKIKQQLQYMQHNNPLQYQRIVSHIHKLRALNQLRQNNPKEFQRFLDQYPVLRKQLFRLKYGI